MDACQSSDIAQQYEKTAVQRIGISKLRSYVTLIRPYQWIKNGLVLAPVLFAGKITNGVLFLESVAAALMFCATASLGYVLKTGSTASRMLNTQRSATVQFLQENSD